MRRGLDRIIKAFPDVSFYDYDYAITGGRVWDASEDSRVHFTGQACGRTHAQVTGIAFHTAGLSQVTQRGVASGRREVGMGEVWWGGHRWGSLA